MTSADLISANGSGRKPVHYNGCFSIRPSTGIKNTEGVIGQFACVLLH
jgi:Asp-tRNA(Asn)/Glu-tRNA(Gln) amidotransferase A subunit family amidase